MKLTDYKGFIRFWIASTTSDFGTYITTLALQVLVVINMQGSSVDVGWINASRWLPYVLLGLVAGVLLDRVSRRPVLVITDIGRGMLLVIIFLMASFHIINIGWLIIIMTLFGSMSLFNDAAYQSFVPQLVPRRLLTRANARLEQSAAVAQTGGPAVAGAFVSLIGAPFAILIDAVSYVFSGLIMATIKYQPLREKALEESWSEQIKEGLRWVYRHRYLGPLAFNTHVWFLFNSMIGAVLVNFALTELGFKVSTLGLVLTSAGIGAVLGTSFSTRAGRRFGIGRSMAYSRILYCPACILMVLAPSPHQGVFLSSTLLIVVLGQFLYGFALGVEGPLEMGYRQSITPARLQGRMNATMRSINRSMIVIGAPLGGIIADVYGFRTALWVAIVGLALVGIWFSLSPMRDAQIDEHASS
ncbi:MFS transporter [Paenibacillus nasutitermitis]|uniref:MFS transporter n=1 Tax=Paenibacillus nasutitermitis TaxID=1652958 RepID=UPI00166CD1BD|nr:MFS transporter [Paenibacillus nasutitermitis]